MLMMKWYNLGWFVKMIAQVMTLLMVLRADHGVIDVRPNLAEGLWEVVSGGFFIACTDGGKQRWFWGAQRLTPQLGLLVLFPKQRRKMQAVWNNAVLPGPDHIGRSAWHCTIRNFVGGADVAAWLYSVEVYWTHLLRFLVLCVGLHMPKI